MRLRIDAYGRHLSIQNVKRRRKGKDPILYMISLRHLRLSQEYATGREAQKEWTLHFILLYFISESLAICLVGYVHLLSFAIQNADFASVNANEIFFI